MKKYFIVTDIEGEILSGDLEFATELQAMEWAKKNREKGVRVFVEMIIEVL